MPAYDYRCDACGHEMVIRHRMAERPKRQHHCDACGKMQRVTKLFTPARIIAPRTRCAPQGG